MLTLFKKEYLKFKFIDNTIKNYNFEKIKKLADGGCSDVYLYKEQDSKKVYVVKQICRNTKTEYSKNTFEKKVTEAIKKEYIMNKIIKHRHIIQVKGIDSINKNLLYEYENSKDLLYCFTDDYKSKDYFKYFIQIIDGVKYMHSLGIAHMDLKLENILYNPLEQKIKIIDFGHTCFFKKGKEMIYNKGVKGTEYYIPPEVWKTSYMSDKVDVWCCGIILYNIIYDRMPWKKADEYIDKRYNIFKRNRLQNILSNEIFDHPTMYGYNYDDAETILELFSMMLDVNYYYRSSINDVYKKLLEITLE